MSAPFFYEGTIASKQGATTDVFGIPVASATQDFPLGARLFDPTSGTKYEYVKFSGVIAANEDMSCLDATGFTVGQCPATAAGVGARKGVSIYTATTGQFGFIAVSGVTFVKYSGTGYTLGAPIAPDLANAGKVIQHTVTGGGATVAEVVRSAQVMGFALEAEGATTVNLLKINLARCI